MAAPNVIDLTRPLAPAAPGLAPNTCKYCNTTFSNAAGLKKHKLRKYACISYQDVENRITALMNDVNMHMNDAAQIRTRYHEECARTVEMVTNYEDQIYELEVKIRKLESERFIQEELAKPVIVWQSISITAPFLSDNNKKTIKTHWKL